MNNDVLRWICYRECKHPKRRHLGVTRDRMQDKATARVLVQIFDTCMFLPSEKLCRFQAARTTAQSSGAVIACPVSGLRLNCCFLIFSANSMPRIVTAA